jgi:hypothetical protein
MASGGSNSASNQAIGGLARVPNTNPSPTAVKPCKQPAVVHHSVGVRLRWQDNRVDVPAVKCQFLLGTSVVHPGPLANGTLFKAGIVGGAYEVTLPTVDAAEWDFE